MKNIIIFYPSFEKGGATVVLINLIKYLSKNRYIYLVTNKKDKKLKKVKNLKILLTGKKKLSLINNRIISGIDSAIILLNVLKKINKKNTIVFSMQSNFFAVILSFIKSVKVIIRVSEDPCGATRYADNKLFAIFVLFTKFITYNFASKIITNAKKSQRCVKRFVLNTHKVKLLYNPTLVKILKKNDYKKKNYFLNVGRLCKQKNQQILIKAFYEFHKNNKGYKLVLCGDGPDKEQLNLLVKKFKLNNEIKFLGWKNNMSSIYSKAKLFILSSYYEGMPNALIDAINFETPSISFNASGVEDLLLNGRGGEIIENYDHHLLAHKMKLAIQNYNKILLKTQISKKYLNKYCIENAGRKYIKYLT